MRTGAVIVILVALLAAGLLTCSGWAGTTVRVNVRPDGTEANGPAFSASISGDGRFVVFDSTADNLVPGAGGFFSDVFIVDRSTRSIDWVSAPVFGVQSNGDSFAPVISANGRFVAFASNASNLVFDDNNFESDIFLWDRTTRNTVLVSLGRGGLLADGPSDFPSISADGRAISFASLADNLVFRDVNDAADVFVVDALSLLVTLVSADADGNQGDSDSILSSIDGDSRRVAFSSDADNLVPDDTNSFRDIFVNDLLLNRIVRASVSTLGVEANGPSDFPSISLDGSAVGFASLASDLVLADRNLAQDIFINIPLTGITTVESVSSRGTLGNADSTSPALNADARAVAFASLADNLVSRDINQSQDVFVRDRRAELTVRVSVASDGAQGDADSGLPAITANGREVAFLSDADNLVRHDDNFTRDVFVHRWVSFSDVPPEHFGFQEVEASVTAGIVQGFGDDTFRPDLVVTRDQMAVFIARAIAGGEGFVPPGPAVPTFSDVPRDFWAFNHIEFLASLGVVQGFPDGTFRPELPVDRAQMAVFIARTIAGGDANVPPGPVIPTFPDVPRDFWAFRHIEFLVQQRVVQGFPDGLYHPELAVDRATMAVFIARAFDLPLPGD